MTLFTAFREALRDFVRSPVRSFIVLQGVIWGTAIGIFPPALINGSRRAALEKASELGTDRVLVVDSSIGKRGFDWVLAARVRKDFSGQVRAGAAFAHREVEIDGKKRIALLVDSGALEVRRYRLAEGAWLTAEEIAAGAPVAVLEAKAAQELFPPAKGGSALGATIHLDDGLPPVKVVGVTAPLPPSFLDRDVFGYEKSHWLHGLVEDIKDSFGI